MKIRLALIGRLSHRTPLAYEPYRKLISPYVEFVENTRSADILIFSCLRNIREHIDVLKSLKKRNRLPHILVISEEPFWDLIWEDDPFSSQIIFDGFSTALQVINHFNSDLFHFHKLPYFITTDDIYCSRYTEYFRRNSLVSHKEWKRVWHEATNKAAFYLEKRLNKKFDRAFPEKNIYGLCRYRSLLAQAFDHPQVARVGLGWGSKRRQTLPDWHLEKLKALDLKSCFISAVENTHHPDYVTEKIFDAYAAGGIPLYWSSDNHRVEEIIDPRSFLNLHDMSVEDACLKLETIDTSYFSEFYQDSQNRLANLFSNTEILHHERLRLTSSLKNILLNVVENDPSSQKWLPLKIIRDFFSG